MGGIYYDGAEEIGEWRMLLHGQSHGLARAPSVDPAPLVFLDTGTERGPNTLRITQVKTLYGPWA